MSIFDGLPDPSAPAQAFFTGLAHGKAEQEDRQVKGALAAYAVNPDDPTAFQTLARYKPELAIQIGQDRTKRQQNAAIEDLKQRAASGDRGALAQLWGIAPDTADKIGDNQRAELANRVSAIGQAALRISQLPPEQRPQAWDSAVEQLSQDYPELGQYKGRYSEDALNSAIDNAKLVTEHFNLSRPDYQVIPQGGTMVNTRDPGAVNAFQNEQGGSNIPTVSSPEEARKLPPGTPFRTPDGRLLRVPGGAGGNAGGNFPNIERYYGGQ